MARGNHRQRVFTVDSDYRAYLVRLACYAPEHGAALLAYCLMPNHVHLLVRAGGRPLGGFMQVLQQSYTQRYNRVHAEVGHLFQGRYKALACQDDGHLLTLVRYIHLNPVKGGLASDPQDYPYSSHRVYLSGRATPLVDPRPVLDLLGGPPAYRALMREDQEDSGSDGAPSASPSHVGIPGTPSNPSPPGDVGAGRPPLDGALRALAAELGLDVATLRGPDRHRPICRARALVAHALVRRRGYPVGEVAVALGRDIATISQFVWRLTRRAARRPVRGEVRKVEK